MPLKTDRERTAHLLRRFGLGASEAEVDYYSQGGWKGAVDRLLNYEAVEEAVDVPIDKFAQGDPPRVQFGGILGWWHVRLMATRKPLLEKMAIFWHDHFATSAVKVNTPPLMYQQVETLRDNATGKFETLLMEMSKDPAMIFWLDNQFNVVGKPNENYAREVMELFTLGIGHYSEKDVQEAARAFTGWSFRRVGRGRPDDVTPRVRAAEFIFRRQQHDRGEKTVLGKTVQTGEDVVKVLCEHPQTAKYITKKLWEWFAYPDPEPAVLERVSTKFYESGLDIKVVLREIMESPEFYSERAERKVFKNPIDFVIPTLRQIGLGEAYLAQALDDARPAARLARIGPAQAAAQGTSAMGMRLLYPADVDGWPSGPAWITSATMVERIQWAERLFGVSAAARGRTPIRFLAMPLFQEDPTPEGVVKKLLSLLDAPLSQSKAEQLVEAAKKASGGAITRANANATAAAVTRLIFGSPEFQFC